MGHFALGRAIVTMQNTITVFDEIRAWAGDLANPPIINDGDLRNIISLMQYVDDETPMVNTIIAAIKYCRDVSIFRPDMTPQRSALFKEQIKYLESLRTNPQYVATFNREVGGTIAVPGVPGLQGVGYLRIYKRVLTADATSEARPVGGMIDPSALTIMPPVTWSADIPAIIDGHVLLTAETLVNPARDTAPYTPTWSLPVEFGAGESAVDNEARRIAGVNAASIITINSEIETLQTEIQANTMNIAAVVRMAAANNASLRDFETRLDALGDFQAVTVRTAASYSGTLDSQLASNQPLIIVITADITGNRAGVAFDWNAGDVVYFEPMDTTAEYWFNIESDGGGTGTADLTGYRTAAAQDIIDNRHTQGILLARQEARTADGKAVAAQEDADDAQSRLTILENRPAGLDEDAVDARITEQVPDSDRYTDAKVNARVDALIPAYIDVEPGVFVRQSTDAVQYHLTLHGYLTNHDDAVDNIQIMFQGQVVHSEAWTFARGERVIDFEVSTIELANVVRNIGARTTVQVQVRFRDGAVTQENTAIREIPVVPGANILQAPVNGQDGAGVTSITLPADYTNYRHCYIGVWETNNDVMLEFEIHTALLAAQTADKTINMGGLFHNTQADRSASAVWSPRARTMTMNNNDLIIFADLE